MKLSSIALFTLSLPLLSLSSILPSASPELSSSPDVSLSLFSLFPLSTTSASPTSYLARLATRELALSSALTSLEVTSRLEGDAHC